MKNIHEKRVKNNTPFVYKFVEEIIRKNPKLKEIREDLISAGIEGLLEASYRFDEKKNNKFLTYAVHYIRKRVVDEIRSYYRKLYRPKNINDKLMKIGKEYDLNKLSNSEKEELLKKENVKDPKKVLNSLHVLSLEDYIGEDLQIKDIVKVEPMSEIEKEIDMKRIKEILYKKIEEHLDERERLIIELRFGLKDKDPMTLEEIGKIMGLSRERIRQLEKRALIKLRNKLVKYQDQIKAVLN